MAGWRQIVAAVALLALADCYATVGGKGGGGGNNPGKPFTTVHKFTGNAGGDFPNGVIVDASGVIYGTTQGGGNCATCGVIFRLTPAGTGRWTYTVFHRFATSRDGIKPLAPLALQDGKLYGTTSAGGDPTCNCGTVFRINTDGSGFLALHTFKTATEGAVPAGGVLVDTDGTIYGTTSAGGANGAGVIFRISTGGVYVVLHHFVGAVLTGPKGELVFGTDGAIYGTQFGGGAFNRGTIFRVTKAGIYAVLHDFTGFQSSQNPDGASPDGALALGADGTIYGTTTTGGSSNLGTAWSIRPSGGNTYRQLHSFASGEATVPHSGLAIGTDGVLYGSGASGGANSGGALFQLTPVSGQYLTRLSFDTNSAQGTSPQSPLSLLGGTIYGTTLLGGISSACSSGCGTVFSFKP
jgi:uncharacterized repeat protein (TIGR03803 family)